MYLCLHFSVVSRVASDTKDGTIFEHFCHFQGFILVYELCWVFKLKTLTVSAVCWITDPLSFSVSQYRSIIHTGPSNTRQLVSYETGLTLTGWWHCHWLSRDFWLRGPAWLVYLWILKWWQYCNYTTTQSDHNYVFCTVKLCSWLYCIRKFSILWLWSHPVKGSCFAIYLSSCMTDDWSMCR